MPIVSGMGAVWRAIVQFVRDVRGLWNDDDRPGWMDGRRNRHP